MHLDPCARSFDRVYIGVSSSKGMDEQVGKTIKLGFRLAFSISPEVFHAFENREASSKLGAKSDYALGGFQDVFLDVVGVASLSLAAAGESCTLWIVTISFLVRKEPRTSIAGNGPFYERVV